MTNDTNPLMLFRTMIDNIDAAILSILFHRAQIINNILLYKNTQHIDDVISLLRQSMLAELIDYAESLGLNRQFSKDLFAILYHYRQVMLPQDSQAELLILFKSEKQLLNDFNRTLKHVEMALIALIAERMKIVTQVGDYKKAHHIPPLAKDRWRQVLESKKSIAVNLALNIHAIEVFYERIHNEALRIEE
ncbi:MAG: chorismate mutase [Francisellaceae bacterium]